MKIFIDAGHNCSGADTGAIGSGLKEQDITFEIASLLKNKLINVGAEVMMSRNKITDNVENTSLNASLKARAKMANDWGAELFVSIHCNSNPNKTANGTETIICGRGGKAEEAAELVQTSIVNKLGTANRGVRVDKEYLGYSLAVLRYTNMPAILIETAFISNADDAKLLKNNKEDFAQAIFNGICNCSNKENGTANLVFPDVRGHWAEKHITKLADYGIIKGCEDGTFRPEDKITRAEAATMISNALSVLGR